MLDITKFIKGRLNGRGNDPSAVGELLAQLTQDNEADSQKLESLKQRRRQALIDGAHESAKKLELEKNETESRIEERGLRIPLLREQLIATQDAARERRWRETQVAYASAVDEFLAAARAAFEKHTWLVFIVQQAQREGFANEVALTMPATPNIGGHALLAPDLLDAFEVAAKPALRARDRGIRAVVSHAIKPRQYPPHERAQITDSQRTVSLALDGAPHPPKQPPQDDASALLPGSARVRVMRQGFSPADDRPQCRFGDIVVMPLGPARRAAEMAAVEVLEVCEMRAGDTKAKTVPIASLGKAT